MKIDLESHFITEPWVEALTENQRHPRLVVEGMADSLRLYYKPDVFEPLDESLVARLLDIGDGRISAMDEAGIDLAILSLTAPGCEQLCARAGVRVAKAANDALAGAVSHHPDRLAGFAALYPKDVAAAQDELERAVKDLGLKGWKTHANFGDSYLDEKRYWPILAKAQELGAPIYLHPTVPTAPQLHSYGLALAGASFGFGAETALAMMRLIVSGAFDAFPDLKVILGHYGEGLPFLLHRVDASFTHRSVELDTSAVPSLNHVPSHYLRHNMWVSTSGNYLPAAFVCTREALGIDKMVLGTDYPYEHMGESLGFLEAALTCDDDSQALFSGNALSLCGIRGSHSSTHTS